MITAPSPTRVITGNSVPVTVRTGADVTGINAFIGTKNISSRFRRHGRRWTASLPAHLVGNGTHRLLVQALTRHGSGGSAAETFTVGHTMRGLLKSVHTRNLDGGTVTVTARTTAATTATLVVNGTAVGDVNDPGFSTAHSWQLTKLSGLRSGLNHVTLSVQERHGGVATKSWTFKHTIGSGRLGADDAPAIGAQGLYVGTDLESVDGGTTHNTMYAAGTAYTSRLTTGSAIIVQLNAATLAPVASSVDGTEVAPKDGTVTIAVWKDHNVSFAGQPNGSRIWIGTREVGENESMADCPGDGNCNTNLHGWLEPAAGVNPATWTDSDMLDVQTRQHGDTATTNTMTVGDRSYPVSLSSGATGGFELLTLNNVGEPTGPAAAYSLVGDTTADATTESRLATALSDAVSDGHVTVVLQGFGKLPGIDPTGPLTKAIASLGGNADVVSRIGNSVLPDNTYALVSARYTGQSCASSTSSGGSSSPSDPICGNVRWLAQESSSERGATGVLQSLLVRDQTQNDDVPMTTTSASTAQVNGSDELTQLIYQAPSSWNDWVPDGSGGLRAPTGAEQAAFDDIESELVNAPGSLIPADPSTFLCPNAPDPLRGALCNADSIVLSSEGTNVGDLSFDASQGAAGGYTATDFSTVQKAIKVEFADAAIIRSEIGDYQKLFGDATDSAIVQAGTISDNILKNLPKSSANADANAMNVLNELTNIVSAVGFVAPELRFFSGMLKLMGMFQPNSGPGTQVNSIEQVTQDTAAATLASELNDASKEFGVYGDFLASDPVKLMQGAHLLGAEYALSGNTEKIVETATEYGVNQYLWGTLMAPVYTKWTGPASLHNPLSCVNTEWPGGNSDPFSNSDHNAYWAGAGAQSWIGLITDPDTFGSHTLFGLPAATADQLAGPINLQTSPNATTNVGAVEPYFENTYLTTSNIPLLKKGSGQLNWCE
ncbi:hypothetical protein [Nostocoides japonicum]|uniref:hypothetical protein n=1 Tax=Nostocoides japonicum TaxID=99481 RepID=UPI001F2BAEED|nr:hypothetical protein [Tetrasphaera japonica]